MKMHLRESRTSNIPACYSQALTCAKNYWNPDLVHALLGRWPCYIAGQDQNCFSPLGTKLHFHVNSLWKRSMVLTPNMAALVVANLELRWYITCNTTISTEFINGNVISVLAIILMVTMPQDEFGLINLYVHCSYNVMKGHDMAPWGLWRGKEKPVMHAFLKPLVIALNSISKNGMYVKFYFLSSRQT